MIAVRKRGRIGYAGLGLRGLGRRGMAGRGMADYAEWAAALGLESCDQSSVSSQYACSLRNQEKINAYVPGTPTYTAFHDGGTPDPAPTYTAPVYTAPAQPVSVNYTPRVTFTNSRGGNILYPGDTWTVRITGGRPSSTVYVMGGKNGASDTTRMGVSDSSGNFELSGAVSSAEVGSWAESWSVGGTPAGSFSFVVQPTATTPATVPPASGGTPTPTPTGGRIDDSNAPPSVGGFDLSAIPWWGWLAGGAGAIFLFGGGRGR